MKTPLFGSNRIQSFIDFFNNIGKIRLGAEGKRLFIESEFNSVQSKAYLTNEDGVANFMPKATLETFDGSVDLSKSHTIYNYYAVEAALEVSVKTDPAPIPGGYAELSLEGDGATTPTFAVGMLPMPDTGTYDNTLGVLNKIGIYYDGVNVFYTITPIP
jgi:hypothetical protein